MNQNDFIEKFVLQYPRLYVRLISHHLAFTEENLIKYGFLLHWDQYGIIGNTSIKWTPHLKSFYSEKLQNIAISKKKLASLPTITKMPSIRLKKNFTISTSGIKYQLSSDEINLDTIRNYKTDILDWRIICSNFDMIDYNFLLEFQDKVSFDSLLINPFIDWSDTRLFSFYTDSYTILMSENVWTKFISKFSFNNTIKNHFEAFNSLDKFVRVLWKLNDHYKNGDSKYLLGVFVKSNTGNQIITSGYYRTDKNYPVGKIVAIGKEHKFPIENDFVFHRNNSVP